MDSNHKLPELSGYLQRSPNLNAMLSCIASCEGTNTPVGYRALFGYHPTLNPGALFDSFDDHPRKRIKFNWTDGTVGYSSAAGRYQIIAPTYDLVKSKYGIKGFTPEVQDEIAVILIKEKGALEVIDAGNFNKAVDMLAPVWASLPASKYKQPKRSREFALLAYFNAGGVVT